MPGDPQSRHEVNACFGLFLYTHKQGAWVYQLSSRLRFPCSSVTAGHGGSPSSVSGLDFFACWLCMVPTELTTRR